MPPKRFPPTLTGWMLAAAIGLALLFSLFSPLNQALWDALNRSLPAAPDPRVVVVGIDDETLRDYGRLDTWDRSLYARALKTLDDAGVQAVGLDILFQGRASGDEALGPLLGRKGVVLASTPEDPQGLGLGPRTGRGAVTGLSVLNIDPDGVVRHFQRSYRLPDGQLVASLAEQLASAAAGSTRPPGTQSSVTRSSVTQSSAMQPSGIQPSSRPLQTMPPSTIPQTIRYVQPEQGALPVLSFRDLVNGTVRYSQLQDKLVVIGLTATGSQGSRYLDVSRVAVPGVILQARTVSSLLAEPFTRFGLWWTLLLGVLAAAAAVLLRGFWGFVIAALAVGLSLPLWLANVQFPGATVSLCAMTGLLLVAAERWWQLRHLGTVDPLTGLGNRLAFTRAVEHRWAGRNERPIGLLLVDLAGFRNVNDRLGTQAGDTLLQHLAGTLKGNKRRADVVFRWGSDEFVLLVDGSDPQELARFAARMQAALAEISGPDGSVRASTGHSMTGPDIHTPTELIERASRMRYRNKYQGETTA